MSKPANPPAFPNSGNSTWMLTPTDGMTLRDWFATFAPQPNDDTIALHERGDRERNPHNDSYKPKLRSRAEIVAGLRYAFADAMLAERERGQ